MRNSAFAVATAVALTALQGCTIGYYDLHGELQTALTSKAPCDIKYFIALESSSYTNTFGEKEAAQKHLAEEKAHYVTATQDLLTKRACKAALAETENEATLGVSVQHQAFLSALPQEWLTGLSFGLIPSWGTRRSTYIYTFKDKPTGRSHSYSVDSKSFNHLILFPVFWISFFTMDESRVYKEALANFIEHS